MKLLRVGLGLLVWLSLVGCPNVEPCSSVEAGDTLELSLQGRVEEYIDYEPLPSCGGADEPPQKVRIKMTSGREEGGCVVAGCPTDFPSPSQPFSFGVIPGGGNQYVCERMGRKINIDGCEARRDVVIRGLSGADNFFSPSSTVVLIRRLGYASGDKLQCADPLTIFPPDTVWSSEDPSDRREYYWCSDAWIVRLARK